MLPVYQTATQGEWGVGIDAVSALDCWGFGLSGFQGLEPGSAPRMGYTPAAVRTPEAVESANGIVVQPAVWLTRAKSTFPLLPQNGRF
jgi:hypothetical protein